MEKSVLDRPGNFNNRELSWLKFNLRVLKEAGVKDKPLFERLKFVAITSSNSGNWRAISGKIFMQ